MAELLILLWKNWIFIRRYYYVTLFEVLCPVLFSLVLLIAISIELTDIDPVPTVSIKSSPNELDLQKGPHRKSILVYAPNTTVTTELMKTSFGNSSLDILGVQSEQHIVHLYETRNIFQERLWGAVIFDNFNGTSLPSSLQYTLLLNPEKFPFLESKKGIYFQQGLEREDQSPYEWTGFLIVQMLIDFGYMHLLLNERELRLPNIEVEIKQMPLPYIPSAWLERYMALVVTTPFFMSFGFLFLFIVAVKRVADEKKNRFKEMMKIMGMSATSYWGSIFISNLILMAISSTMITAVYAIPVTESGSIFQNTSPFLLFATITIYCASSLLLYLVVSTLFTKPSMCIAATVILWTVTLGTATLNVLSSSPYFKKMVYCLIPNTAFQLVVLTLIHYELFGRGSQWGNIFQSSPSSENDVSIGIALMMMIASCLLYSVLLLYLDAVWPWQPGVPKPPLFFINKLLWGTSVISPEMPKSKERTQSKYFEEEPSDELPSVVIYHVTKVFGVGGKRKTVDDLNLNIYPGQITALLGRNGAGKTTLMNILSGIFPPTSGSATINGYDIVKDTNLARRTLGFCPQYNVLYNDLSVIEHLKLFSGLKGKNWWGMGKNLGDLLRQLQLMDKLNTPSKDLTGGMKRKLCLANAIAGFPQFLILDEPTTGLDPESRQNIWDLLSTIRSKSTILLSTHNMEEADTIGDRIAIMASGRIQCYGSPSFLKRAFGSGYKLLIGKSIGYKETEITNLIQHYIPEAEMTSNGETEMVYSLSHETSLFGQLFKELENFGENLGITSCGIDVTTMDYVYMKVGQMSEECLTTQEKDKSLPPKYKRRGKLYKRPYSENNNSSTGKLQKMEALFLKRARYAYRSQMILVFQVVLPLLGVMLFLYFEDDVPASSDMSMAKEISYDLRNQVNEEKYGFYYLGSNTTNARTFVEYYKRTLVSQGATPVEVTNDPRNYLFHLSDLQTYIRSYLVGASVEGGVGELILTAWFNGIHQHMSPISMNLLTSTILRFLTKDDGAKIQIAVRLLKRPAEVQDAPIKRFSVVFLSMGLTFLSSSFVLFPSYERVIKSKLLQRMCGISGFMYWLVNFSWDFLVHSFASLVITIPFLIDYGIYGKTSLDAITSIFLLLFFSGISSISLSYLVSFIVEVPSTGFVVLTVLNVIVGIGIMPEFFILDRSDVILWFLRLFPTFATSRGIESIYFRSANNVYCSGFERRALLSACNSVLFHYCCTESVRNGKGYRALPYFSWETKAAGKELFSLIISSVIWTGLILLLESNIIKRYGVFIWNTKIKKTFEVPTGDHPSEDADVHEERNRIEDIIIRRAFNEEALVTFMLTKNFRSLRAVNNLTFGVHRGECFGLLGIHGAGKTTMLRMLVGDLIPSGGNAYIRDSSLRNKFEKFQTALGYCPQFFDLIDRLNTIEILELYANLRGIPRNKVKQNVQEVISMCNLEDMVAKEARAFSGGNRRKLSLAIALIGAPSIILLDEPTSGIDPAGRRKIWEALKAMKDTLGISFVFTSHSMEECEALCNRCAIMVNGEFRCLGSMQHLKSKFGQGYTVIAKVKDFSEVNEVKTYIEENIPSAELKASFRGTLHYLVTDTSLKWSTLFEFMDGVKLKYQLEDYIVCGTRLEQIFLSFARSQRGMH